MGRCGIRSLQKYGPAPAFTAGSSPASGLTQAASTVPAANVRLIPSIVTLTGASSVIWREVTSLPRMTAAP